MSLEEAINAVDMALETGDNLFGNDSGRWSVAERILEENGDKERAEEAHHQAVRAYRYEEWRADLL